MVKKFKKHTHLDYQKTFQAIIPAFMFLECANDSLLAQAAVSTHGEPTRHRYGHRVV
ncbi:hypothetical protein APED_32630 [Acanthopleuribacter pedis]